MTQPTHAAGLAGFPRSLVLLALAVILLFTAWFLLPVNEWLKDFGSWIEALGIWGYVLFAGVYALASLVLAPGTPLTIAAGLVFGLSWGFVIVQIGATLGAALAFLAARYLAHEKIAEWLQRRPKLVAVNDAITEDGWKLVLLLRLSPLVPFNLQNYFFGVTEIRFWHFVWATFIGIIPGALLYLYLGAAGGALMEGEGKWGAPQWGLFGLGLLATLVLTVIVARKAKAKLGKMAPSAEAQNEQRSLRAHSSLKSAEVDVRA